MNSSEFGTNRKTVIFIRTKTNCSTITMSFLLIGKLNNVLYVIRFQW